MEAEWRTDWQAVASVTPPWRPRPPRFPPPPAPHKTRPCGRTQLLTQSTWFSPGSHPYRWYYNLKLQKAAGTKARYNWEKVCGNWGLLKHVPINMCFVKGFGSLDSVLCVLWALWQSVPTSSCLIIHISAQKRSGVMRKREHSPGRGEDRIVPKKVSRQEEVETRLCQLLK